MDVRDRLIVALDLPSVAAAESMVQTLGDAVSFYKIGYQLAFAGGLALAEALVRADKRVFLDLKLHDIGNTVAKLTVPGPIINGMANDPAKCSGGPRKVPIMDAPEII
jgi:orotidine-5'-phosphate decarboxylase